MLKRKKRRDVCRVTKVKSNVKIRISSVAKLGDDQLNKECSRALQGHFRDA